MTPTFTGTQSAISKHLGPAAEKAGRRAGSSMGKSMAEGLAAETAGMEAEVSRLEKSVVGAQDKVTASRTRSEAAMAAEQKALGDVRVAELRLSEVRDNANAKASQVAAAEERLSSARSKAATASRARETAEQGLARSTKDLGTAQNLSAQASENLESHLKRVSAESSNTERSFGRLGNILNRSFRGRPLAEMARGIREDTERIDFDLHNMAQKVSQQGTKGGRAFTQGFVGVVGGLSVITPVAGAAGASLIGAAGAVVTLAASMKNLAGVSALAPAALITVGAGVGVLKAALFGVGDALKASTEASGKAAGNAALDAMALQDAARGVAKAQQSASESGARSAKRISDAERNAADVRTSAAERVTEAQQRAEDVQSASVKRITDAERNSADVRSASLKRVSDAEQRAADVQAASAKSIESAKKKLEQVTEQVSSRQAAAVRRVADAERDAERANERVTESYVALNDARAEAAQRAKDLQISVVEATFSERSAVLRLEDATASLEEAQASGADASSKGMRRRQLDFDEARFRLILARKETARLTAEEQQARAAGVAGSKQVQSAEKAVTDAREAAADAARAHQEAVAQRTATEREGAADIIEAQQGIAEATAEAARAQAEAAADVADAVAQGARDRADAEATVTEAYATAARDQADAAKDIATAVAEGARDRADAEDAVTEAYADAARDQANAAEAVADAYRNLERVQMQQADAAGAAGDKAAEAMAKLTPNARTAVAALLGIYDQLGNIRRIAQENFFAGFTGPLQNLAATVLPQLATGVGAIASAFGAGAQQLMTSLTSALGGGVLEGLLLGVADTITILNGAIDPLVQAFVTLGVVGMEYMPQLAGVIRDLATQFNTFIQGAAADGSLKAWIDSGIQGFRDVTSILGSVVGIFGALDSAARAGGIDTTLGGIAGGLNGIETAMQGSAFQGAMATIFEGAAAGAQGLANALGPIGEAFRTGAPALAEFLRLGGEIAGTFVGGVFTALSDPGFGAGLVSFLESLQRGVSDIVPLLPGLTGALGGVLAAAGPIVEALGPTLVEVFTAFGEVIGRVLDRLSPLLSALAGSPAILGLLIGAFVATAAASAALTAAGNIQRIAMAAWKVAVVAGTAAQWLFNAAMSANPIGLVIIAITALVAALVWFFTQTELGQQVWSAFVSFLGAAWTNITAWITGALTNIASFMATSLEGLKAAWSIAWNWIRTAVTVVWNGIKSMLWNAVQWVANSISSTLNTIKTTWSMAWNWVRTAVTVVWDGIKAMLWNATVWVATTILNTLNGIKATWSTAWNWVRTTVTSIWDGIKAMLWNATVWVANTISNTLNGIKATWQAAWSWVRTVVTGVWDGIKSMLWNAVTWVANTISSTLDGIKWTWSNAWNWVRTTVTNIWDGIKSVVWNAWNNIKGTLDTLIGFVRDKISAAFEKAKDGVGTAWDALKAKVKDPIRAVVGFINEGLIGKFNGILTKVGLPEIPTLKLPQGFAEGGRIPGYSPTSVADNIPIMATANEFMVRQKSALKLERTHPGALDYINKYGKIPGLDRYATGGFIWPVGSQYPITQRPSAGHRAYDIGTPIGTPVKAVADGRVSHAGPGYSAPGVWGGTEVHVDHGGGVGSLFAHLSSLLVRVGDMVKQNQTVALSGNTGISSGPHLHFGGLQGGMNMVTPDPWLNGAIPKGAFGGVGGGGGGGGEPPKPSNPLDGVVDTIMNKLKEAFPKAGMFVDVAGALAKTGVGQVVKMVEDIKNGLKNVANNVFMKVKDFFGVGAATLGPSRSEPELFRDDGGWLPPGVHRVRNDTGQGEAILNPQQWHDISRVALGGGGVQHHWNISAEPGLAHRYAQDIAREGERRSRDMAAAYGNRR